MSEIIYLDDLPFNLTKEESDYLFSLLPDHIAGLGTQWGYDDTVFREDVFKYIVKEKLGFSDTKEYYKSEVFKNYQDNGVILSNEILFGKTEKYKISFSLVFFGKHDVEIGNSGSMEIITANYEKARKNAFFAVATNIFKSGHVLKSLEITKIEKIENEA